MLFLKISILLGFLLVFIANDFFFIWISMEMISLLLLSFLFLKKSLKINSIGFQKMSVLVKYMFIQIISSMVIFFSFILSSFLFDVFKLSYSLSSI